MRIRSGHLAGLAIAPLLLAAACTPAPAAPSATSAPAPAAASGGQVQVGLITKTESNPFFVKMKEGADKEATAKGAKLLSAAGKFDTDNQSQVTAIENMVTAGAKGILITPSDTKAIVPTVQKARNQGIKVITLDTPLDPQSAVSASRDYSRAYLHHLVKAGEILGQVLLSWHNVAFFQALMAELRAAIAEGRAEDFRRRFAGRVEYRKARA